MPPTHSNLQHKHRPSLTFAASLLIAELPWIIRVGSEPALNPVLGIAISAWAGAFLIAVFDWLRAPQTMFQESLYLFAQSVFGAIAMFIANAKYLEIGHHLFFPYLGFKLLILCFALATPPRTMGTWFCFALMAFGPLLQTLYWMGTGQTHFPLTESWINIAFAVFAILLWRSRLKMQLAFQRVVWLEARAHSAESLARLLLSARHLQNSALQTIEARTSLIEMDVPQIQRHTQEIQKAVGEIVHLSAVMELCDDHADWTEFVPPKDRNEFHQRMLDFKKQSALNQ